MIKHIQFTILSLFLLLGFPCFADEYEDWVYDQIQIGLVNQKSGYKFGGKLNFPALRELCYMIFTEAERQNVQIIIDNKYRPNIEWCNMDEKNVNTLFILVLEANDYLYHDATTELLLGKTKDEEVPYCVKRAASDYCGYFRYSVQYKDICKPEGSAEEIHCSGDRCVVNQKLDCKNFGTQYWSMCCKMDLNSTGCPDYVNNRGNTIKTDPLTLNDYDTDCYVVK